MIKGRDCGHLWPLVPACGRMLHALTQLDLSRRSEQATWWHGSFPCQNRTHAAQKAWDDWIPAPWTHTHRNLGIVVLHYFLIFQKTLQNFQVVLFPLQRLLWFCLLSGWHPRSLRSLWSHRFQPGMIAMPRRQLQKLVRHRHPAFPQLWAHWFARTMREIQC